MARILAISMRDEVPDDVLPALAAIVTRPWRAPEPDGPGPDPDDELALFRDHDALRGQGCGYFRFDEGECRSRRLDMRGPLDLERDPIEMEEAESPVQAVVLEFR